MEQYGWIHGWIRALNQMNILAAVGIAAYLLIRGSLGLAISYLVLFGLAWSAVATIGQRINMSRSNHPLDNFALAAGRMPASMLYTLLGTTTILIAVNVLLFTWYSGDIP